MKIEIYKHVTYGQVLRIGEFHIVFFSGVAFISVIILRIKNFREKNINVKAKFFMSFGVRYGLPVNKDSLKKELQFFHRFTIGDSLTE